MKFAPNFLDFLNFLFFFRFSEVSECSDFSKFSALSQLFGFGKCEDSGVYTTVSFLRISKNML